jgi:hypothetical protein
VLKPRAGEIQPREFNAPENHEVAERLDKPALSLESTESRRGRRWETTQIDPPPMHLEGKVVERSSCYEPC